jgi:hypothetical protein
MKLPAPRGGVLNPGFAINEIYNLSDINIFDLNPYIGQFTSTVEAEHYCI